MALTDGEELQPVTLERTLEIPEDESTRQRNKRNAGFALFGCFVLEALVWG